jgi:hypothetical protein
MLYDICVDLHEALEKFRKDAHEHVYGSFYDAATKEQARNLLLKARKLSEEAEALRRLLESPPQRGTET